MMGQRHVRDHRIGRRLRGLNRRGGERWHRRRRVRFRKDGWRRLCDGRHRLFRPARARGDVHGLDRRCMLISSEQYAHRHSEHDRDEGNTDRPFRPCPAHFKGAVPPARMALRARDQSARKITGVPDEPVDHAIQRKPKRRRLRATHSLSHMLFSGSAHARNIVWPKPNCTGIAKGASARQAQGVESRPAIPLLT